MKLIELRELEKLLNYEILRSGATKLDIELKVIPLRLDKEPFFKIEGSREVQKRGQIDFSEVSYPITYSYLSRFWKIISKNYLLLYNDVVYKVNYHLSDYTVRIELEVV